MNVFSVNRPDQADRFILGCNMNKNNSTFISKGILNTNEFPGGGFIKEITYGDKSYLKQLGIDKVVIKKPFVKLDGKPKFTIFHNGSSLELSKGFKLSKLLGILKDMKKRGVGVNFKYISALNKLFLR